MEPGFFEGVRDALEGFVGGVGGTRHVHAHSRGLKVWFDDDTREHYEAQIIRLDGDMRLEIGFHAEHSKAPLNADVLRRLITNESHWRDALGSEAVAGEFIGRRGWQRISEVWPIPEGSDVDEVIEVAARLADYITTLEPVRRT